MATLFAPPELLSAFSYAVDGSDPDLPKGTHVRVFAGMGASFPLTPLAVFKIRTYASQPYGWHVTDMRGNMAGGLDLSRLDTAEVTPLLGDTDTERIVRIEFVPGMAGGIKNAQLLDQQGRLVAERDAERFLFSAPVLRRFRISGSAPFVGIQTRSVRIEDIVSREAQLQGVQLLGLPIKGRHSWYFGVLDRQHGFERVVNGAPLRLNVMDRPDGPFDALTADDELARVKAMITAGTLAGGLEKLALKTVDDTSAPPWAQIEEQVMQPDADGTKQFAIVPRLSNLQMAALDPGLARFLGFADCIGDLPDLEHGLDWDALAVAGLFVIDPRFSRAGAFGFLNPWSKADPNEIVLIDMIARALASVSGDDVRREINDLISRVKAQDLLVRAMLTVTAPTPPWLAPDLPKPVIIQRRWQTAVNDITSTLYRASFAFSDAPLASMAAMSANIGGTWVTRHGVVDVGARQPSTRANPRIFGHETEPFSRVRELNAPVAWAVPAGLLSDQDLADEAGVIPYRFFASDFFGRFGDAANLSITAPPRPDPPKPVLRFHIERANVDPASKASLSPGKLRLTFAVPQSPPAPRFAAADQSRLASAVAVPSVSEMAAGAYRIQQANLSLDAQSLTVDVSTPGFYDAEFDLPGLLPQETRNLELSAIFIDTAGAKSIESTQIVKVTDMRPPEVVETGIGLFWTSAPGPSPEVELKLAWPAAPNSLHRVYATDQQGLSLSADDLAEDVTGVGPSRGRVAEVGCSKVLSGAPIPRNRFRLLTDPPVKAGADARAVLQTALPRSLETVQFLRVVPLTAEGAEAPFDSCGIVPVAVPNSRRPVMPRLEGAVDFDTGVATLEVIADGFDRPTLQRDEPGLFDGGAAGNMPPTFRIRRAVGAVIDPIYGRIVASGTLAPDLAAPVLRFVGSAIDDSKGAGLEPFVQYIYWAEVSLPPERRLPAGVIPLDPPGGVTVVDPENAADHEQMPSLPSAPRVLLRAPEIPPGPPAAAAITITRSAPDAGGNVELAIEISDPPMAHPKAVDQFRLAIWSQWPTQPITPITKAEGAPLNGEWPTFPGGALSITVDAPLSAVTPIDPSGPVELRLAFIDPLGRMSKVTTITVPS